MCLQKTKFSTFVYALGIGFVFCKCMFLAIQCFILEEQGDTQPNNLCNDPHPRHSEDNGHKYVAKWMNLKDASQHKAENTDTVEKLSEG